MPMAGTNNIMSKIEKLPTSYWEGGWLKVTINRKNLNFSIT
jgi:hypothetical protein